MSAVFDIDRLLYAAHTLRLEAEAQRDRNRPVTASTMCDIAGWIEEAISGKDVEPPPVYLTESQVAKRFNVSVQSLQKWRRQNTGPRYFKFVGSIRYRLSDIEAFESSSSIDPGTNG